MSGPGFAEWMSELRALLDDLREQGQEQIGYGFCCVEDPRDFSPDPECSSEEERARHKADCDRVDRGEPRQTQTRCQISERGILTPSGYGLGTYSYAGDPCAADAAERLERVIDQAERWYDESLERMRS